MYFWTNSLFSLVYVPVMNNSLALQTEETVLQFCFTISNFLPCGMDKLQTIRIAILLRAKMPELHPHFKVFFPLVCQHNSFFNMMINICNAFTLLPELLKHLASSRSVMLPVLEYIATAADCVWILSRQDSDHSKCGTLQHKFCLSLKQLIPEI